MHRFFTDKSCIGNDEIKICGDDAHHISRVLRLGIGEDVVVCDMQGTDYLCNISGIDALCVSLTIKSSSDSYTEPPIKLCLYQGVPKGDKLETVIQKCVELGTARIVPVAMKRSVAQIKDKDKAKKNERHLRIAYEAAKQCGRGVIPTVGLCQSFKEALLDAKDNDVKLLAYEAERQNSLKDILKVNKNAKSIALMIGPEGGFSPEELSLAADAGFEIVGLGPRIMRTETAPIACIAAIMYEIGDW